MLQLNVIKQSRQKLLEQHIISALLFLINIIRKNNHFPYYKLEFY